MILWTSELHKYLEQELQSFGLCRVAGSNVKRRGQPFQKGTCFSAIVFPRAAIFVKTLLWLLWVDYLWLLLVAIVGRKLRQ
jgi:hypothetical protein